jgi:endonuclease-3 related protein
VANFTESIPAILRAVEGLGLLPFPQALAGLQPGTFPAIVASYLSRSIDDRAVKNVLDALEEAGWSDASAFGKLDPAEIDDLFQASGIRGLTKSIRPLLKLAQWFTDEIGEVADEGHATEALRDGLRSLTGIGPATADALLRDGFGRASYPVDRATYRILVRHGWLDQMADYDEARGLVEAPLSETPERLLELALGFEAIGRQWCKAGVPKCEKCPLRELLPESGPYGDSEF